MLSIRLQKVLDYIKSTDKLADVGCDHGYLAIGAINKGVTFVQLIDNKEGPLQIAKNNLKLYETKAKVIYTLTDGLFDLNNLINVVCICGMGGDLIYAIVNNNLEKAKRLDCLILQANSKVEILRYRLSNLGFEIVDEDVILDRGKYYEIMKIRYNPKHSLLNEKQMNFGPILLKKRGNLYNEFLKQQLNKINKIIEKNNNFCNKLNKLRIKKYMLEEILNETI